MKERQLFEAIREEMCSDFSQVQPGKMMSSDAITYGDKVFAFLSKKDKMVFKLGKDYDLIAFDFPIDPFNPFKKKGPLSGWHEVDYAHHSEWKKLTQLSLDLIVKK